MNKGLAHIQVEEVDPHLFDVGGLFADGVEAGRGACGLLFRLELPDE